MKNKRQNKQFFNRSVTSVNQTSVNKETSFKQIHSQIKLFAYTKMKVNQELQWHPRSETTATAEYHRLLLVELIF